MPFEPGHRNVGGRPKGSKNKKTIEFENTLKKYKFDIPRAMIDSFKKSEQRFEECLNADNPDEEKAASYMGHMISLLKEMASYVYPKLKGVEVHIEKASDLSDDQKIAQFKQAIALLEAKKKEKK